MDSKKSFTEILINLNFLVTPCRALDTRGATKLIFHLNFTSLQTHVFSE